MEQDEILTPWYSPFADDDEEQPERYGVATSHHTATDYTYHAKHIARRERLLHPAPIDIPLSQQIAGHPRQIVDHHRPVIHWTARPEEVKKMMMAVASARQALRGKRNFLTDSPDQDRRAYNWFDQQRRRGLQDVWFLCSFMSDAIAQGVFDDGVHEGIVCSYASGDAIRFTFGITSQTRTVSAINGRPLVGDGITIPSFADNTEAFRSALLDAASYALDNVPDKHWAKAFLCAAKALDEDDVGYLHTPQSFVLPSPLYKIESAYDACQLGGGMGSWADVPCVGMPQYIQVNQELEWQRTHAMLYAIHHSEYYDVPSPPRF